MRFRPAASASRLPVAVEPVKLIRRTAGFSQNSSPIGPASPGACVTMFSTPSGRPASAKIWPQISPPTTGDSSDGFSTTVFPSASGAAIERADRISAAFHGAIAATTPTGLRMPMASVPGWSEGRIWPSGEYAAAAAWRSSPGTKLIWNMAKPKVAPVSRASSATTSSRRDSRTSAALRKIAWRCAGRLCDHSGNAAAAASIARTASSRPPAGTSATTSPVKGSRSSNVPPPEASVQAPPMYCLASPTPDWTLVTSSPLVGPIRSASVAMRSPRVKAA